MTDSLNEDLWSVIESAVSQGVSLREFLERCHGHWLEALGDQRKDDTAVWNKLFDSLARPR